jgi:hypothetical protein
MEDRRLIDAKFGLVMKVEMHSDRSFRSGRARKIAQAEFDLAEIGARNGVALDPADLSAISSIHQLVSLIAAAATVLECRTLEDEMNWYRVGCSDHTRTLRVGPSTPRTF